MESLHKPGINYAHFHVRFNRSRSWALWPTHPHAQCAHTQWRGVARGIMRMRSPSICLKEWPTGSCHSHSHFPPHQLLLVLKPYSTLWLHHTTQKRQSLRTCVRVLHQQKWWDRRRRVGVTPRVLCTWWLLGLAVKDHGWERVGHLSPWLHGQA